MRNDFNTLHLLWAIRDVPSSVLNLQEKMILTMLLACAGTENRSWHSQLSLASICSISETTVKKYTKSLAEKSFIIIHSPKLYCRSTSNQYELNIDKIMTYSTVEKGSSPDPLNAQKGSPRENKGSRRDCGRGRRATTKKETEERKEDARARAPSEAPQRVPPQSHPAYTIPANATRDWTDDLYDEVTAKIEESHRLKKEQVEKDKLFANGQVTHH